MSPMRRSIVLPFSAVAALAACSVEERPPAAAAGVETALLAEQAGTWEGQSTTMEGDSVVTSWRFVSTADTTGWSITIPDVPPIPVRVIAAAGDSIVMEFGPYDAPGPDGRPQRVQRVRAVGRMEDGQRVGTYEVRLAAAPDSVIRGRFRGTRVP